MSGRKADFVRKHCVIDTIKSIWTCNVCHQKAIDRAAVTGAQAEPAVSYKYSGGTYLKQVLLFKVKALVVVDHLPSDSYQLVQWK